LTPQLKLLERLGALTTTILRPSTIANVSETAVRNRERSRTSSLLAHGCQDGKQRIPLAGIGALSIDAGATSDHPNTPTIDHGERLWDRARKIAPHHRIFPKRPKSDLTGALAYLLTGSI
jgi:hypothetical protein